VDPRTVAEPRINARGRLVDVSPPGCDEPHRKRAQPVLVEVELRRALEARTSINPHRMRPIDEDISDARVGHEVGKGAIVGESAGRRNSRRWEGRAARCVRPRTSDCNKANDAFCGQAVVSHGGRLSEALLPIRNASAPVMSATNELL